MWSQENSCHMFGLFHYSPFPTIYKNASAPSMTVHVYFLRYVVLFLVIKISLVHAS